MPRACAPGCRTPSSRIPHTSAVRTYASRWRLDVVVEHEARTAVTCEMDKRHTRGRESLREEIEAGVRSTEYTRQPGERERVERKKDRTLGAGTYRNPRPPPVVYDRFPLRNDLPFPCAISLAQLLNAAKAGSVVRACALPHHDNRHLAPGRSGAGPTHGFDEAATQQQYGCVSTCRRCCAFVLAAFAAAATWLRVSWQLDGLIISAKSGTATRCVAHARTTPSVAAPQPAAPYCHGFAGRPRFGDARA